MWLSVRYSIGDACSSSFGRVMHMNDFKLGWPVVSLIDPTVQKRKSLRHSPHLNAGFLFVVFFSFQQRLLDLLCSSHFWCLSKRDCLWDHPFLIQPWGCFECWPGGTTKVASGRMQPFWTFVAIATVTAVKKCECLTWCIGDVYDQQPIRSPQTSHNWVVVFSCFLFFFVPTLPK